MKITGKSINEIKTGEKAFLQKTITEADILMFAAVSTDTNPAHINEEYAKTTMFKKRIAHGVLSGSLISSVLGTQLPGPGSIYINQTYQFKAPVFINDTLTAIVEVKEINTEKNRVLFRTYVTNQDDKVVLDGEATIMPPKA
jgi:3-hydroxybutyryl-CoA dehydratase